MARYLQTDDDILNVLHELSEADAERECQEEEDNIEYDELSDQYDSDADPEYIPDEEDLLHLENVNIEAIREIENVQEAEQQPTTRQKKRPGQRSENRIGNDGLVLTMDNDDGVVVSESGFLWGSECEASVGKNCNCNCNRKTQRWPLCIFYNMMNIAAVNSYVIYVHNVIRRSGGTAKPMSRQEFMFELHSELTKPWQEIRISQRNMSRALKRTIHTVLTGQRNIPEPAQPDQHGIRKYCSFCDTKKKRMTTTYCACGNAICGEHQKKLCPDCG